jgi:hypothetical protein
MNLLNGDSFFERSTHLRQEQDEQAARHRSAAATPHSANVAFAFLDQPQHQQHHQDEEEGGGERLTGLSAKCITIYVRPPSRATLEQHAREEKWLESFTKLQAFYMQHGHSRITKKYNRVLYNWCSTQRQTHRGGSTFKHQRIECLLSVDFNFNPDGEEQWQESFKKLQELYAQTGHSRVTKECNRSLSNWCRSQRYAHGKGTLSDHKIGCLDSVKFSFQLLGYEREVSWEESFKQLHEFYAKNGHSRVTAQDNRSLYNWCCHQSKKMRNAKLGKKRSDFLDSVDFGFRGVEVRWQKQFKELEAFQKEKGHSHVAIKDNASLAHWCILQRRLKLAKHHKPSGQRHIDLLDSIGFSWKNLNEVRWQHKYTQLKAFRQVVTCGKSNDLGFQEPTIEEGRSLKLWCVAQRKYRRADARALTRIRIDQLDEIGFRW